MKIAVYGDSFANTAYDKSNQGMDNYHWSSLLKKHYNAELYNYGAPGSSIYFSYNNFIKHHTDYDLNVFLVTEPGRYIKPVVSNHGHINFLPSLSSLEVYCKTQPNSISDKQVNNIKGWFLASCDEFNQTVASLMIEKIISLDNNVLIIPCFSMLEEISIRLGFGDTPKSYNSTLNPMSLMAMQYLQTELLGLPKDYSQMIWEENKELMAGHFTPEFNKIIFDKIMKRIETGLWDWELPADFKFNKPKEEYYIRKIS